MAGNGNQVAGKVRHSDLLAYSLVRAGVGRQR